MKYLRTFLLALQSEFTSRANLVGWLIVGAIPSIILVFVWFSILGQRSNLGGFTRGDFIIYYFFMTFGWYIVGGAFARNIGNGIKNGKINTTLLKPYDVVLGQCIEEQAWKVMSIFITFPITAIILFLLSDSFRLSLSLEQIVLLILSLIFGGINFAFIEAIVGISAFWFLEVWPIDNLKLIFMELLGGILVPLALMPPIILSIANLLPFKYTFYVPVSILLSKAANPLLDVSIQFIYILILFGIYKLIWNLGIRKYEATGG